ncbi:MAG: flavodoxin family protein [Peptostreptococcaceae bacterium]|jgi:multimeric flavodoxin WrbA|nr:flavodoxin family protein [Peptostreptococcaceae bacterium]
MKITTINGSPRKNGCSEKLLSKVREGARDSGIETISFIVNRMNIKGCQACMFCKQNKGCIVKDDMAEIYMAIDQSDVVVFGVPIYTHEMSAQLKTVFDRFYLYSRMDNDFNFSSTMKKGKKCILIISYGNHDKNIYKKYAESLVTKFKHVGFEEVTVFVASDSMNVHPEYLESCYEIGRNLC